MAIQSIDFNQQLLERIDRLCDRFDRLCDVVSSNYIGNDTVPDELVRIRKETEKFLEEKQAKQNGT